MSIQLSAKAILDNEQFKSALKEMGAETEKQSDKSEKAVKGFSVSSVLSYAAVAAAITTAVEIINDLSKAAADAQIHQVRLQATLKSSGRDAEISAGKIGVMAEELMALSTFDDEAIIDAYNAIAKFDNVPTESMESIVKHAMDMSAALGTDLADSAEGIARVLETGVIPRTWGFDAALKETIGSQIKAGQSGQALQAILGELGNRFGGQSDALLDTYNGKWKRIENTWENIKEAAGNFVLPALTAIADTTYAVINTQDEYIDQTFKEQEAIFELSASFDEYVVKMLLAKQAMLGVEHEQAQLNVAAMISESSMEDLAAANDLYSGEAWDASHATDALGASLEAAWTPTYNYQEMLRNGLSAAELSRNYTEDMADAVRKLADDEAILAGLDPWQIGKIKEARDAVNEDKTAIQELAAAHRRAMDEMIAGWFEQRLAADGQFTEIDMQKVLDYRRAMGLLTQDEYDAAQQAIDLQTAIMALPENTDLWITTHMVQVATGRGGVQPGFYQDLNLPSDSGVDMGSNANPYERAVAGVGEAGGTGGWRDVPVGYSNDNFPMRVSSGEEVNVRKKGEGGDEATKITNILPGATLNIGGKLDAETLVGLLSAT